MQLKPLKAPSREPASQWVAFTIRACSLLTVRWHLAQSMPCQSTSRWEDAHVVETTFICFSSFRDSPGSLVTKDQAEVCPLSRGMILPTRLRSRRSQSLSCPLQTSLRFLRCPLPTAPSVRLAAGLPRAADPREGDGLTVFHELANLRGRRCLSTDGVVACVAGDTNLRAFPYPFWVWLVSVFSQFLFTMVSNSSRMFALPFNPGPLPPDTGRFGSPRGCSLQQVCCGVRCPERFAQGRYPPCTAR